MSKQMRLQAQLHELQRAISQEVAAAHREGRQPLTAGLHWATCSRRLAGQIARELEQLANTYERKVTHD